MFLQNLRARLGARLSGDSEAGFTLIELLVVMLILGILAAIALPAFFNQRDKAGDSKAKENAHSAQVAMETFATEHGGSYVGANEAALTAIEPTIKKGAKEVTGTTPKDAEEGIIVSSAEKEKYKIESVSSTGNVFSIENNKGTMSFTCTAPGSGGCPAVEDPETELEAS
jgi:type IV pilus assembly protein PilA